jgi:hypothetical protein
MNNEPNTFFLVSTEVTLNSPAGLAEQGRSAIETDAAIYDFANDIDSKL